MGSAAFSTNKTADQRTVLDTGEIGQFAAPDSIIANPSSSVFKLGTKASLHQSIQGLTGPDVNTLAQSIFADEQADQTAIADLAKSAITSMQSLTADAQAAGTADYQKWLPFVILGVIAVVYLGAKR